MSRDEMLLRHGWYCGFIERKLGDASFAARWFGRAQEITEADYLGDVAAIQARLRAAGVIAADEDPFLTADQM